MIFKYGNHDGGFLLYEKEEDIEFNIIYLILFN